ncbi:MAG: hypothetical protein DMG54_09505 [Acidobacteria bacterium]|nr:MAG: hypothetical protein DMG54_09505 [Acidobacteriota bacterium]PYU68136.1 MAG: hypothetical protein DMG52_32330 [Acidobacteriota bacterium]
MSFDLDAFISYAHMDNVGLIEGHKGWVTNLHRALEIKVGQFLGKQPQIWRDPKLTGDDVFADILADRLRHVAVLISVVSPCYVRSEWARRELVEFWKAAEQQGGVHFHNKARIFKVLKTPVRLEMHPPELQPLLGYEFFNVDPETGRIRELDEVFGVEAQRDFWMKLDDLAHDICALLEMIEGSDIAVSPDAQVTHARVAKEAVFLAEATIDVWEQHEMIRRDLQQHGYTVLPASGLPLTASEMTTSLREDLARCRMSIHMVGKNYAIVPEGSTESLPEIQSELAIERGKHGGFSRLIWLPSGLHVEDERQRAFVEKLRMDPRIQTGADLLETSVEDLRTVIQDLLKLSQEPVLEASASTTSGRKSAQVYFIYDQRDAGVTSPWADFLFDRGFEVIHPVFEGDEAEIREYHEENLRVCDGVLILYGAANELWVRRKLRELQKSAGYGRTKPAHSVAVSLVTPKTIEKERFRTHDAMLIQQFGDFSPDPLLPFIACLKS